MKHSPKQGYGSGRQKYPPAPANRFWKWRRLDFRSVTPEDLEGPDEQREFRDVKGNFSDGKVQISESPIAEDISREQKHNSKALLPNKGREAAGKNQEVGIKDH